MIGRGTRACTSTASTFIATCIVPSAAPTSSITSTSDGRMPIRNGIGSISSSTTPASSASWRAPSSCAPLPASGNDSSTPHDIANSTLPSAPSLSAMPARSAGMRETQDANAAPLTKKTRPTPQRARVIVACRGRREGRAGSSMLES